MRRNVTRQDELRIVKSIQIASAIFLSATLSHFARSIHINYIIIIIWIADWGRRVLAPEHIRTHAIRAEILCFRNLIRTLVHYRAWIACAKETSMPSQQLIK